MPQIQISAHRLADIITSPYFLLRTQNPCDSRRQCIGNIGRLLEVGTTKYRCKTTTGGNVKVKHSATHHWMKIIHTEKHVHLESQGVGIYHKITSQVCIWCHFTSPPGAHAMFLYKEFKNVEHYVKTS
jgi:hypothetical protein